MPEANWFYRRKYDAEMQMNIGSLATLPNSYFTAEVHHTDFFEIIFFEKAKGKIILNQRPIELNDLSFVFISPFQKRQWLINPKEIDGQFLIFQEDFLNDFFSDKLFTYRLLFFYQLQYPLTLTASSRIYNKVQEIYSDIQQEIINTQCDSSHIVRSLLYFLLMKLNREYAAFHQLNVATPLNNYAYQFKQLLEIHIKENQRVDDYTRLIGVSRITLNKALQMQFNVSTTQLIKQRLAYEIKNYLIYTKLSINQIAGELNFSEPNHLMRFFKQQTGITAAKYRTDYQNGSI